MSKKWVFNTLFPGEYRYEEWLGSSHLVVPGVILVEGVHNGVLYPSGELQTFIESWNGIPIPIYHPEKNGRKVAANTPEIAATCVGRFWNAVFDYSLKGIRGEFWIDVEKAESTYPGIVDKILNGKMEVSTGLWGEEESSWGEWRGEEYVAVLRNYRPDHVALLPDELGACSWLDGCGIRANSTAFPKFDCEGDRVNKVSRVPSPPVMKWHNGRPDFSQFTN